MGLSASQQYYLFSFIISYSSYEIKKRATFVALVETTSILQSKELIYEESVPGAHKSARGWEPVWHPGDRAR